MASSMDLPPREAIVLSSGESDVDGDLTNIVDDRPPSDDDYASSYTLSSDEDNCQSSAKDDGHCKLAFKFMLREIRLRSITASKDFGYFCSVKLSLDILPLCR